ncbi:MAG: C58 family peptidase [Prevotellaceae bacterium]|nr:C58 family peptidase [Prevotellaceae bacterium]
MAAEKINFHAVGNGDTFALVNLQIHKNRGRRKPNRVGKKFFLLNIMALETLKTIGQGTWLNPGGGLSKGGVCYYMCNFLESELGIWSKPESFANAVNKAKDFGQGTAMMNYAKAQNSQGKVQQDGYAVVNGPLKNNRIYRVMLAVVEDGAEDTLSPNHEMIAITGEGDEIVYFEPNFGFFRPSDGNMNNREALEHFVNQQYAGKRQVTYFAYRDVRGIAHSSPLSFA